MTLDFSRPGKPMDNDHLEAFDGRGGRMARPALALVLDDARGKIEARRSRYDRGHQHNAQSYPAPGEFAAPGREDRSDYTAKLSL